MEAESWQGKASVSLAQVSDSWLKTVPLPQKKEKWCIAAAWNIGRRGRGSGRGRGEEGESSVWYRLPVGAVSVDRIEVEID